MNRKRQRTSALFLYLLWGGCATLVNICAFQLLRACANLPLLGANAIAWLVSVLFAFETNKSFVFASSRGEPDAVGVKLLRFILARLFSGCLDMAFMYIGISVIGINDLIMKIAVNAIVVAVNYLSSAFFVFAKRRDVDER